LTLQPDITLKRGELQSQIQSFKNPVRRGTPAQFVATCNSRRGYWYLHCIFIVAHLIANRLSICLPPQFPAVSFFKSLNQKRPEPSKKWLKN